MAGFGSDPFVERVREANDIVEVIGEVVSLKKAGSRWAGLCPFHQEKTASFYVNPGMQAYHCFGCGAGGDVFSFVMAHEKLTFPEAVRHLAERAGLPLPTQRGPGSDKLERIREALRMARGYYRGQLEGPAGAVARAYLEHRGIRAETRERYGLGYSPDRWDALLLHARALVSDRILIEAGLAAESEAGRVYDRFRNRVMIPIESAAGVPVGFGGRLLGDGEPKYVNSPETPVYRKGSVLFGTGPAREGIRSTGRVVVVEGYFDVIALAQSGLAGVVGTCGTALTPEQASLLRRMADRVVVVFDGDAAGLRAALRALPILVATVPEVFVARPPEGKDPDLWVREAGPEAVAEGLERAPRALAFLEALMTEGGLSRREAARRAAELAAAIPDPLDRDLWTQEAAGRFGISPEAFREAVRRIAGARPDPSLRPPRASQTSGGSPAAGGAESGPELAPWGGLERECIRAALHWPEHAAEMAEAAQAAGVFDPDLAEVLRSLGAASGPAAGPAALLSRILRDHPRARELAAIGASEGTAPAPSEVLVARLALRGLRRREEELQRGIRRAQEEGNREDLDRFLRDRQQLALERTRLERAAAGRPEPPRPRDGAPGGKESGGQW